ncbi:MAG: hypothetical protein O2818_00830 [Bacteroidetes bacterium]|nr:hypothetical protein [Bacteroidota bacterium]MDA1335407.1 hypothetical protein [Bacteroidota bacterium]
MSLLYPIAKFIEALRWVFGNTDEFLQSEIQSKRQLIRDAIKRSMDAELEMHQESWRNVAQVHLQQIQGIESKRSRYMVDGLIGLGLTFCLLFILVLTFII